MKSVSQLAEAIQRVLTTRAKALERETGFVQRSTAQLDGPSFAQTTVLCWMDEPEASYSQLQHVAASLGVPVSNQALEQRFGPASARFMQRLLEEAVGEVVSSQAQAPELIGRFNGVYLQDGSLITLPAQLAQGCPGWGGNTPQAGQSSMRVQVRLELAQGKMQGPWLQAGRQAERRGPAVQKPLPKGCLYNVDSGYFTLKEMRHHDQQVAHHATAGCVDRHVGMHCVAQQKKSRGIAIEQLLSHRPGGQQQEVREPQHVAGAQLS